MTRYFAIGVILLALCGMVAACGKKGDPSPPGPQDQVIYPKTYPTQ